MPKTVKIPNEILEAALPRVATATPQPSQPEPEVAYPSNWRRTVKSAAHANGVSRSRAIAAPTRVQLSRPASPHACCGTTQAPARRGVPHCRHPAAQRPVDRSAPLMPRTPTGIKVTKPSNTTGSGVKIARSDRDIASRNTGSIEPNPAPSADKTRTGSVPTGVIVPAANRKDWSSVTGGDSRGADHQSVTPTTKRTPSSREAESWESLGYGGAKNP